MSAIFSMDAFYDAAAADRVETGRSAEVPRSIRFGGFEASPSARALVRNGALVDIGSRAFDILMVLLIARGEIVSKDRIIRAVWPTTTVVDSNLKVQLSLLRRALGAERWRIKTVSGRGYLIVMDDAGDFGPALLPAPAAPASEGPLIIMIDAEPGMRELMAQAISELARRFNSVGGVTAQIAAGV